MVAKASMAMTWRYRSRRRGGGALGAVDPADNGRQRKGNHHRQIDERLLKGG